MANSTTWRRVRTPLSLAAVVGFLGVAVVAPFSVASDAEAAPLPDMDRINQTFVPNENPELDLVYVETPIVTLPDPEEERKKREAEEAAKQAAEDVVAAPAEVPKYTGGGSPAQWMAAAGIPESDWGYVDFIVNSESGWNPNAVNASSGASGLVQALPCGKVPGSCFDPVDNLRWADGYAKGRYGSWAKAHAFWNDNHWW